MGTPRNKVEEAARIALVFGAIILLISNLIPRGGGRDFLIWLGAILIFIGIVGSIVGVIVSRKDRGGKSGSKHYGYH
jgi:hypothetical protein